MKNLSKSYLYIFILLIGVSTGCEDYLDINDNPNNPTKAPAAGLLANASFSTGNNVYNAGNITSYYVQYLASPNPSSATDIQEEVSYDAAWEGLYNIMTDLSDLEITAAQQGGSDYVGIAKILKAINLGLTVDLWGQVPYSEAFFAQTLAPKYDAGEALYTEIFTLLEEGIAELNKGNSTLEPGGDDFVFGGDTQKWIKTAYALKARYLNHYSKQPAYAPNDVLAAVDNGFQSNEDDAQVVYFDEVAANRNPWATDAINNDNLLLDGWLSEQFINAVNGTTFGVVDPRLPFMAGTTDAGTYVGTVNGAGRGTAPERGARSVLTTDTYYAARTAPVLIITFAELKFIEAEAAFRNNNLSRAYQAYLDGIRAHMSKLGVSAVAQDAYLAEPTVSVGEANLTIDLIMKEKYVAMFLHPEAWTDARRYNYNYQDMTVPANLNPNLNGNFIRRLAYPTSEITRNRSNVPVVSLTDRLFWDQQ